MSAPEQFSPVIRLDKTSTEPLYAQIAHGIQNDLIRRGIPASMGLPSERSLCETLGVSRGTVRKALHLLMRNGVAESSGGNRSRMISSRMEAVRQAALPRSIGIILLQSLSECLRQRSIESLEYAGGIIDASAECGQSVTFINLPPEMEDGSEELAAWHAALKAGTFGVIHFGLASARGHLHPAQRRLIEDAEMPQVAISGVSRLMHMASVQSDPRPGTLSAAEHLRELGHRRIGIVISLPKRLPEEESLIVPASAGRPEMFLDALRRTGLECREEWVTPHCDTLPDVHACVKRLLAARPRPTALLCQNDAVAMAAIACLRECGMAVPREMSVIGFDDARAAAECDPPLTTIRQPRHSLGRRCFELLARLRASGGSFDHTRESMPTSLVIRGSTAPAPNDALPG